RRPGAVEGLQHVDQAARRFLPRAADVPHDQRRAGAGQSRGGTGKRHRGRGDADDSAGSRRCVAWSAAVSIVGRSRDELEKMREAGRLVGEVLTELATLVAPGVTTSELDAIAEKRIAAAGATPAFKGYHGYPATICASINEEVIHGIPSGRRVLN